ncbi:MAG: hypothetical protein JSR44_10765 [Spirochaetes bacterium]|nr:hypothetical protein [Spirochaetota bacterium]
MTPEKTKKNNVDYIRRLDNPEWDKAIAGRVAGVRTQRRRRTVFFVSLFFFAASAGTLMLSLWHEDNSQAQIVAAIEQEADGLIVSQFLE